MERRSFVNAGGAGAVGLCTSMGSEATLEVVTGKCIQW